MLYKHFKVGAWLEETERSKGNIENKFIPKEKLPQGVSDPFFLTYLQHHGYDVDITANINLPKNRAAATAFQAHFSRNQYPNQYGKEVSITDMVWIWGLNEKYKTYK